MDVFWVIIGVTFGVVITIAVGMAWFIHAFKDEWK